MHLGLWPVTSSRRHPERSRSSGEARDLPLIDTRVGTSLYDAIILSELSLTEHAAIPPAPAASAEISGTKRDDRHKPHPARPASSRTSRPHPAPVAMPGSAPDPAPRHTCKPRSGRRDASPPVGTIHPYPPT